MHNMYTLVQLNFNITREGLKVTDWRCHAGTVQNGSKQSVHGRRGTVQNGSVAEFAAERFRTVQNGSGTNCSLPWLAANTCWNGSERFRVNSWNGSERQHFEASTRLKEARD